MNNFLLNDWLRNYLSSNNWLRHNFGRNLRFLNSFLSLSNSWCRVENFSGVLSTSWSVHHSTSWSIHHSTSRSVHLSINCCCGSSHCALTISIAIHHAIFICLVRTISTSVKRVHQVSCISLLFISWICYCCISKKNRNDE